MDPRRLAIDRRRANYQSLPARFGIRYEAFFNQHSVGLRGTLSPYTPHQVRRVRLPALLFRRTPTAHFILLSVRLEHLERYAGSQRVLVDLLKDYWRASSSSESEDGSEADSVFSEDSGSTGAAADSDSSAGVYLRTQQQRR